MNNSQDKTCCCTTSQAAAATIDQFNVPVHSPVVKNVSVVAALTTDCRWVISSTF